jgi:hypothetical protein
VSIVAALLFGSLARNDSAFGSDTDLLMISMLDETRHVSIGHLSLFLYPWEKLERDAREGDLFVCHLVYEAKPLLDPHGYLPSMKQTFCFRESYQSEIARAVEFGWYLAAYGGDLNPALLAKRALWCVRTILIARSAEQRTPIFAPSRLAEGTHSPAGQYLLRRRRDKRASNETQRLLRKFLEQEIGLDQTLATAERDFFDALFAETANKVALQTLRQEEASHSEYLG